MLSFQKLFKQCQDSRLKIFFLFVDKNILKQPRELLLFHIIIFNVSLDMYKMPCDSSGSRTKNGGKYFLFLHFAKWLLLKPVFFLHWSTPSFKELKKSFEFQCILKQTILVFRNALALKSFKICAMFLGPEYVINLE